MSNENQTTFRIVVKTQVHENYGTHSCECESGATCTCTPCWKAKGGNEYHLAVGTSDDVQTLGSEGLEELVNKVSAKVEKCDRFFQEYMINWELVPSTEQTYEEQMYREMYEEGYWPEDHKDGILASRLAELQLTI